jgi:polyhydroxyalkanoate synthesis regulator phasin
MAKNKKEKVLKIDVGDLLDQALVLGSSLVYLTKDSADAIIEELEKKDLLSPEKGRKLTEDIKKGFSQRKEKLNLRIKAKLKKVIDNLGIATKEDLEKLRKAK